MPYKATVYQVFIASPSDVTEERQAVFKAIHQWSAKNSRHYGIVLSPVGWETHSAPATGRPQTLINEKIVEPSDILIAVIGHKLGSPTGTSESGTIEEIDEFRKRGRSTMIYFSMKDVPQTVDPDQWRRVKEFQKKIIQERWALFDTFSTTDELITKINDHLTIKVREISTMATQKSPKDFDEIDFKASYGIDDEQQKLLYEMAKVARKAQRDDRYFHVTETSGNGGEVLLPDGNTISAPVSDIIYMTKKGLLMKDEGSKTRFFITPQGFKCYESLEETKKEEVHSKAAIKPKENDVIVKVIPEYYVDDTYIDKDGKTVDCGTSYWVISIGNNSERRIYIDSFQLALIYNGKEHSWFKNPIKNEEFKHKRGSISFPYVLSPGMGLQISMDEDAFDSEFRNYETGELDYPEKGCELIAYFEDQVGNRYRSNPYGIR